MYAILDIETTGGQYNEEGITEIAIYRFDGHEIVDQFSSLVNPERPIQPYVAKLTGITNQMVSRAPKFYEIAKRVVEITDSCTLVAHNANFDSRILKTEFNRLGYAYERKSLCTVELSKILLPGLPSYSLGKLTKHLGIPLSNRHRAQGDAKATVSLFQLLLSKDSNKTIIGQSIKHQEKTTLHSKHLSFIENAPTEIGVYYLYNDAGKMIYIGSGKNIRKKLTQHFTYQNNKSKRLQAETTSVAHEKAGTLLIASIKELEEIRKNKPLYNKRSSGRLYTHQLSTTVDASGYIRLQIDKADGRKRSLTTFSNLQQAETWVARMLEENELTVPENTTLSAQEYNEKIQDVLDKNTLYNKNVLLVDRGRTTGEKALLWISKGWVVGYGFYTLNHQITQLDILKNIITPIADVKNATHLINKHLRHHPMQKMISLHPDAQNNNL